jgi:hypothetical protein
MMPLDEHKIHPVNAFQVCPGRHRLNNMNRLPPRPVGFAAIGAFWFFGAAMAAFAGLANPSETRDFS